MNLHRLLISHIVLPSPPPPPPSEKAGTKNKSNVDGGKGAKLILFSAVRKKARHLHPYVTSTSTPLLLLFPLSSSSYFTWRLAACAEEEKEEEQPFPPPPPPRCSYTWRHVTSPGKKNTSRVGGGKWRLRCGRQRRGRIFFLLF